MSNHFIGRGNLGANPDLKQVTVEGEPRTVTELRAYFDRQVPDGNGGFEDRGGFWLPVHLWGPRGESVAKLLPKGARVRVEGTLVQDTWEDKDSETVSRIEVQADSVDLELSASRRSPSARRARPRTASPLSHTPKPSVSAPADAQFTALGGIWRSSQSLIGASVMHGAVSSPCGIAAGTDPSHRMRQQVTADPDGLSVPVRVPPSRWPRSRATARKWGDWRSRAHAAGYCSSGCSSVHRRARVSVNTYGYGDRSAG